MCISLTKSQALELHSCLDSSYVMVICDMLVLVLFHEFPTTCRTLVWKIADNITTCDSEPGIIL